MSGLSGIFGTSCFFMQDRAQHIDFSGRDGKMEQNKMEKLVGELESLGYPIIGGWDAVEVKQMAADGKLPWLGLVFSGFVPKPGRALEIADQMNRLLSSALA